MAKRRRLDAGMTVFEQHAYEVQWYRANGKHQDRIRLDHLGREYVECDFTWNKTNHFRQESIRDQLANYVQERLTGLKR